MRWNKRERSFVEAARVARVATVDEKGDPHNVPICPLMDGERIYFATQARAQKVRNLSVHPKVAITFDDYAEAWEYLRGVLVVGDARVVNSSEFRRLRKKLYRKFLAYEETAPLEEGESLIVEILPRRKTSWGFDS